MFDADAYRHQIEALSLVERQQQIEMLRQLRNNLNDSPIIDVDQINRIDSELKIVNQKLQIIRALM